MSTSQSLWNSLPVLIRAPVTAMLVLFAAVYPTSFLLQANVGVASGWPWAIVPGGLYLWLLWRYLGGWGPPTFTAENRRRYRSFHPMPAAGRLQIWLTAAALAVTIFSYAMIKLLTETGGVQQTRLLDALAALPATTVLPLLAMMVLMTAFFEEAAFRGYMQTQLCARYRASAAILGTALLFAGVHFPALGQLPLFVFGSLGWGVLTYLSRTIVPAIVMHGIVDGVMFFWVWMNPDKFKGLLEQNVLITGWSDPFTIWVSIAVVATACTIFGFYRMWKSAPAGWPVDI